MSRMNLSVTIEGLFGLTWPRWKRLVTTIEQLGFSGLFRSDHFVSIQPPDQDALESVVSLTYLAATSQRLHFGSLVAPLSFRDPVMLARQAMALDDLSGGRMILGVGAGWMEREHKMFGYPLGDVPTRLMRLEEGLEVITRLIRSCAPVNFDGRFFQLHEAQLLPRPQRIPPVLVGGNGPKRLLPLVARYADIWNCQLATPEVFAKLSAQLDQRLCSEGRQPNQVRRTVMVPVICWRDHDELTERLSSIRRAFSGFGGAPDPALLGFLRSTFGMIDGAPEHVIEQLKRYATAGADELIVQWFSMDDIEGLEILASDILPQVTT